MVIISTWIVGDRGSVLLQPTGAGHLGTDCIYMQSRRRSIPSVLVKTLIRMVMAAVPSSWSWTLGRGVAAALRDLRILGEDTVLVDFKVEGRDHAQTASARE